MKVIEGCTLHYVLTGPDAAAVNALRRKNREGDTIVGFQEHHGNHALAGEHVPAVVARVWKHEFGTDDHGVNIQCLLDGNDSLWKTSIRFDDDNKLPGTVHWIEREEE